MEEIIFILTWKNKLMKLRVHRFPNKKKRNFFMELDFLNYESNPPDRIETIIFMIRIGVRASLILLV